MLTLRTPDGKEIGGKMVGGRAFWKWVQAQAASASAPLSAPRGENQPISTRTVSGYGRYRTAYDGSGRKVLVLATSAGRETGHKVVGSTTFWAWVGQRITDAYPSEPTPAPEPIKITAWRAPGSAPLSDTEAASRVAFVPERRPANSAANAYKPSATELHAFLNNERNKNRKLPAETNPLYAKVTGGFTGTTDEIIQWAAHKWGIPEDWVRAQAVTESYWNQSAMGDQKTVANPLAYPSFSRIAGTNAVKQSLGLMQIKWNHPDANTNGIGTEPLRWKSTAFNVDYTLATIRWYYDGLCSWCTTGYSAGQQWESLAAWYSPYPWKNSGQLDYLAKVRSNLANRTWEGF